MDLTFIESKKDPGRDCFVYTAHSDFDLLGIDSLRGRSDRDLFGFPRRRRPATRSPRTPPTCW